MTIALNRIFHRFAAAAALAAGLAAAVVSPAQAGIFDFMKNDGHDAQLAAQIRECQAVLEEFTAKSDTITRRMIKDSEAVVIFNTSIRGGLGISGQYSHGVMLARKRFGGWSQPAFFRMIGMGIGLQIGGESGSVVMVVRGKDSLEEILENRFTMGAAAGAAAGEKGRKIDAAANKEAAVMAFGKTKGLYAGMSFDGAVLKQDAGANKKYYGKELTARQILIENKAPKTSPGKALASALSKVS